MPTIRSGCFVPAPSVVIESDDVFDARMQAASTTFSMRSKSSRFAARSSTIASTTSCATHTSGSVTTVAILRERGIGLGPCEAAFGHLLVERFGDAALRRVAGAKPRVVQLHAMAMQRGDLRDAGAHRSRADDGDDGVLWQRSVIESWRHQRPVKRGGRFAANAATPSR